MSTPFETALTSAKTIPQMFNVSALYKSHIANAIQKQYALESITRQLDVLTLLCEVDKSDRTLLMVQRTIDNLEMQFPDLKEHMQLSTEALGWDTVKEAFSRLAHWMAKINRFNLSMYTFMNLKTEINNGSIYVQTICARMLAAIKLEHAVPAALVKVPPRPIATVHDIERALAARNELISVYTQICDLETPKDANGLKDYYMTVGSIANDYCRVHKMYIDKDGPHYHLPTREAKLHQSLSASGYKDGPQIVSIINSIKECTVPEEFANMWKTKLEALITERDQHYHASTPEDRVAFSTIEKCITFHRKFGMEMVAYTWWWTYGAILRDLTVVCRYLFPSIPTFSNQKNSQWGADDMDEDMPIDDDYFDDEDLSQIHKK